MSIDMARGMGEGALETFNRYIPEPDINMWMDQVSDKDRGKRLARRIAVVAFPLFGNAALNGIVSGSRVFGACMIGVGIGLAFPVVNVLKAWVINKALDGLKSPLKNEIKRVVDSAVSVLINVAFLVITVVFPIFGPLGIMAAVANLALSIGTLARESYKLHEKRMEEIKRNPPPKVPSDDSRIAAKLRWI